MGPSDRFAFESLLDHQQLWIAQLPATLRLTDDVLLVHGTMRSDEEYFLETVTDRGCRAATVSEIMERMESIDASLTLCGHTHVPRVVLLEDGRMIVNPGSVGLQAYESYEPFPHRIQIGSAHARYALIERRGSGWKAELRGVTLMTGTRPRRWRCNAVVRIGTKLSRPDACVKSSDPATGV